LRSTERVAIASLVDLTSTPMDGRDHIQPTAVTADKQSTEDEEGILEIHSSNTPKAFSSLCSVSFTSHNQSLKRPLPNDSSDTRNATTKTPIIITGTKSKAPTSSSSGTSKSNSSGSTAAKYKVLTAKKSKIVATKAAPASTNGKGNIMSFFTAKKQDDAPVAPVQ
jgi:hypothetical protein